MRELDGKMRELDGKEMAAITGGSTAPWSGGPSPMIWPTGEVNPLTVTFGTPIQPGLVEPAFWPSRIF